MSNHVSEFTHLVYTVTCIHPLQVVALLCILLYSIVLEWGFPDGLGGKESACNVGDLGSTPGLGRREWLPTPVFLPGEFHGQRTLAGNSQWGCKESDMTE